ncbi:MAG: type II secretion system major pseudopilin GspG [Rhodoblastus sp.]|nr:MAG: type II secretion system major pseudopilin GspG [Rhodoblastus sp.]
MINKYRKFCHVKRARRHFARSRGFSIVEILVVLAIIGMIMSLVGPRVLNFLNESKFKTARLQIENIASALDIYYLDNGRYPSSSEGLKALTQRPSDAPGWNGPYLKGSAPPNDPWGRAYGYRSPGQSGPYEIYSQGPDGSGAGGQLQRSGDGR